MLWLGFAMICEGLCRVVMCCLMFCCGVLNNYKCTCNLLLFRVNWEFLMHVTSHAAAAVQRLGVDGEIIIQAFPKSEIEC